MIPQEKPSLLPHVLAVLRALELDIADDSNGSAPRRAYRRVLRARYEHGDPTDAWTAVALNNLAVLEARKGRHLKALELLQRAWGVNDALGDSVSVMVNLCNLATVSGAAGRVTDSARFRSKAIKAWVAVGERDLHPSDGFVGGHLSRVMELAAWMEAEDESLKRTPPPLPTRETPSPRSLGLLGDDVDDPFDDAFFSIDES